MHSSGNPCGHSTHNWLDCGEVKCLRNERVTIEPQAEFHALGQRISRRVVALSDVYTDLSLSGLELWYCECLVRTRLLIQTMTMLVAHSLLLTTTTMMMIMTI